MGYCISQKRKLSSFFIAKAHFADTLQAIKGLKGKETYTTPLYPSSHGFSGVAAHENQKGHFSWVETEDFMEAETLEQALKAWRWYPGFDLDGNINGISFEGEKYGDEMILFAAIAPWVKEGGELVMKGEDGEIFRWYFTRGKVVEQKAKQTLTWPAIKLPQEPTPNLTIDDAV